MRHPVCALLLLPVALLTGGCDEPFSPLASSEGRLSVFGYLDAAADTQWIRVMPIRPLALAPAGPLDVTVTLEHLGTGRTVELRDSLFLFSYEQHSGVGMDGAHVHTFWTTEPVEPGASYRFTARRPGAEPAEAVVEIPEEYELQVEIGQPYRSYSGAARSGEDVLQVEGSERVPFVSTGVHAFDACGLIEDSVRFNKRAIGNGSVRIPIEKIPVPEREGCGRLRLERRELRIVVSRAEWPSGWDSSPWSLDIPEQETNVSNAVGFLGGVLSKVIPYENCSFAAGIGSPMDRCPLRYGPESATLTGTVTEVRCGDGLMDTVRVELRELDGEPAESRKIRETFTNPAGLFSIGALEPGIRYALKARAKPEPDPFWGEVDIHTIHTDTLTFSPGAVTVYPIRLERLTQCGGGQ